jgi:cell division protein FtsL
MLKRWLASLFCVALVAAPVMAGLFRVWVHNDAVQVGYQLSEGEAQRKELRRAKQQLEVELAAEKSPDRLTKLAAKLGMAPVRPDQLLGAPRAGGRER